MRNILTEYRRAQERKERYFMDTTPRNTRTIRYWVNNLVHTLILLIPFWPVVTLFMLAEMNRNVIWNDIAYICAFVLLAEYLSVFIMDLYYAFIESRESE